MKVDWVRLVRNENGDWEITASTDGKVRAIIYNAGKSKGEARERAEREYGLASLSGSWTGNEWKPTT